jgi:hypothetical protein
LKTAGLSILGNGWEGQAVGIIGILECYLIDANGLIMVLSMARICQYCSDFLLFVFSFISCVASGADPG